MFKKWFIGLFLVALCASVSFSQNTKRQNETNWEYLSVGTYGGNYREYNYLTSGIFFSGPISIEWLKESGWEMVGVSECCFYFKRPYNKTRTEQEIERLKKEFNQKQTESDLIDLDAVEGKQNLDEFNKSEESNLRIALENIKIPALQIISVKSTSKVLNRKQVRAELVLDATSILLKDGKYRSSEADKYYQEGVKQIIQSLQITPIGSNESHAKAISQGSYRPRKIGEFIFWTNGISLKVSVIINYKNKQIIVAQDAINTSNYVD